MEIDIKEVVKETLKELERQGKIRDPYEKSPYKKTESLLYNLKSFYDSISFRYDQIATLKEYGIPKKSKSFTTYLGDAGYVDKKSEMELLEERIEEEHKVIYRTRLMLDIIENAIDNVPDDKGIANMLFRENMTPSEIAEKLSISETTVSKDKSKFIKALSVVLFPDGALEEGLYK